MECITSRVSMMLSVTFLLKMKPICSRLIILGKPTLKQLEIIFMTSLYKIEHKLIRRNCVKLSRLDVLGIRTIKVLLSSQSIG